MWSKERARVMWGGPPGPRPTPPSASVFRVSALSDLGSDADDGVRPTMRPMISIVVLFCALMPVLAQAQKGSLASLIQEGNRKAALAQIRAGADVNEAQPDGTRPIHWAVYKVDYELLDALIAKRAKVDVANEFGSTPLAEAAKLADARMVKMLLDAGARPDTPNQDGETALMLAIKTGALPVV
jgi:ankyrin repeat protein